MLSNRLRLATTLGGGVTLAYCIALWMDWPRPYWAGFAVAMVSLSTYGESVFKGLQRLAGTVAAVVVAIMLISWYGQERWMFALVLSLWIGLCVWRMQVDEHFYYFWYCSAFIVPLLSMMSGFNSAQSFYVVELRARQTLLGVLCFIAVALLVSAPSATVKFHALVRAILALLRERLSDVLARVGGAERSAESGGRIAKIARDVMALPTLRNAARLESFEFRERGEAWRQVCDLLPDISRKIDQLDISFDNAASSIAPSEAAALSSALDELEARLRNVSDLIFANGEDRQPIPMAPQPSLAADADTFSRGEALLRHATLVRLDDDTVALARAAADIADKSRLAPSGRRRQRQWRSVIPDPEVLAIVAFQLMAVWAAFLMFLYVPALPDGAVIVVISASFGLNIARMPWIPSTKLLVPIILVAIYAAAVHIVVMPHLTTFTELGMLLFISVFAIGWLFHTDELQAGRFLSIAFLLITLQVSNDNQSYSATYIFNMVVVLIIIILELALLQRMPISFRPEDVVLRMLRRYGRNLVAVFDEMQWDKQVRNSWFKRQMRAYHLNQLMTLPQRIEMWLDKLPEAAASETDRDALNRLAAHLDALSLRVSDLVELRERRADGAWVALLREDVRAWRLGIQDVITQLVVDRRLVDPADLERRLNAKLNDLEAIITAAAASGDGNEASVEGTAHMQRVLSAYRGISFAILGVARTARAASWDRLAEPRF